MQNRIDALIKKGIEDPSAFDAGLEDLTKLSNAEKVQLRREFKESLNNKGLEVRRLTIRKQLEDIAGIISLSYIAEHYFNKSRQWLNNRLNENIVNGKPVTLTPEQVVTLNNALKDISKKIGSLHVSQ